MARIAGINIPMNKHVVGRADPRSIGVGRSQARAACEAAGVKPETKVKDLTESEVAALRSQVAKLTVEGDLRREKSR
jgi:small subunit ribosomal protein S13